MRNPLQDAQQAVSAAVDAVERLSRYYDYSPQARTGIRPIHEQLIGAKQSLYTLAHSLKEANDLTEDNL